MLAAERPADVWTPHSALGTLGVTTMDRREKQIIRDYIGQHLDVRKTRLSDDEALFLRDLIDEWAEKYRGRKISGRRSHDGWSSDGKFTRVVEWVLTFTDDVGIRIDSSSSDDGVHQGSSSSVIKDAREILNWLRENRQRLE